MNAAVLWIRRDLRMSDNPALSAALDRAGSLVPVFILDPTGFTAWVEGCAGYPVVGAAMSQLNASVWMHNRARTITASFLKKTC